MAPLQAVIQLRFNYGRELRTIPSGERFLIH